MRLQATSSNLLRGSIICPSNARLSVCPVIRGPFLIYACLSGRPWEFLDWNKHIATLEAKRILVNLGATERLADCPFPTIHRDFVCPCYCPQIFHHQDRWLG